MICRTAKENLVEGLWLIVSTDYYCVNGLISDRGVKVCSCNKFQLLSGLQQGGIYRLVGRRVSANCGNSILAMKKSLHNVACLASK
jgi:hypothetical protein